MVKLNGPECPMTPDEVYGTFVRHFNEYGEPRGLVPAKRETEDPGLKELLGRSIDAFAEDMWDMSREAVKMARESDRDPKYVIGKQSTFTFGMGLLQACAGFTENHKDIVRLTAALAKTAADLMDAGPQVKVKDGGARVRRLGGGGATP